MTAIFGLTKLKQRAQGTKNVSQTVSTRSWTLAENVFSPDDSFIGNNWKKHKKIARNILMTRDLNYQMIILFTPLTTLALHSLHDEFLAKSKQHIICVGIHS